MLLFRAAPATVAIAAASALHAARAVKVDVATVPTASFPEGAVAMRGSKRVASVASEAAEPQGLSATALVEQAAAVGGREGAASIAQQQMQQQLRQQLQLPSPSVAPPGVDNSSFLAPEVTSAAALSQGGALDDPPIEAFLGPTAICTLISSVVAFGASATFTAIRSRYPKFYGAGSVGTKLTTAPGHHGWAKSSMSLSLDDAVRHSGLDQAMLLEFAHVSMQILFSIGCITQLKYSFLWPLRYSAAEDFSGGASPVSPDAAWDFISADAWLDAIMTWLIVLVVQKHVCKAQARFRERRQAWLKDLPAPRATTLLVEDIPKEHCSDEKLKAFFNRLLRREVVASAHVVKRTEKLLNLVEQKMEVEAQLKHAEDRERSDTLDAGNEARPEESIESYKALREQLEQNIKAERMRIHLAAAACADGIYTTTGFVTFKTRYDAELALSIVSKGEEDCVNPFACCTPPEPSDIMYSDFLQDPEARKTQEALGYFSLLVLLVAYAPCSICAVAVSNADSVANWLPGALGGWFSKGQFFAALWNSLAGALMLQVYLSFAPSFLAAIQCKFFRSRAESWLQNRLQKWYFYFHLVHALLVPAVCLAFPTLMDGTETIGTVATATASQSAVGGLEAVTTAVGDFYLRFIIIQWAGGVLTMLRASSIFWYLIASVRGHGLALPFTPNASGAGAKPLEPEDQDYSGLGSRSARMSFALVLCLVFCAISPLMPVFGFLNFALCRLIYGYLTTFVESRKPDLGGIFWSTQMSHLQQGVVLFIFVSGVLLMDRGTGRWPGFVAWSSALLWYFFPSGDTHLQRSCDLKDLEEDVVKQPIQAQPSGSTYEQPELCELCFRSLIDQFDRGYLPARRGAWAMNEAG